MVPGLPKNNRENNEIGTQNTILKPVMINHGREKVRVVETWVMPNTFRVLTLG